MLRPPVDVDKLILSIHAACLSQDRWAQVVSDLCQALDSRGASLVRPVRDPYFHPSATLFEFDAAFVKQYAEYWGHHDVWYEGAIRTGRIGVGLVNVGEQLIDYRDYKKSAFFNEYLKPMNIDRMMNVCIAEPDSGYGPTALSFYRALGKEAFSEKDAGLLSLLAPHLGVAVQNYFAVQSMRLLARAHANALDAITSAVFGIAPSGRVAFTNQMGDELLRQQRWMRLSQGVLGPMKGLMEATSLDKALRRLSTGISFKVIVTEAVTRAQAIVNGVPISHAEPNPHPVGTVALVWVTPVVPNVDVAEDLATLFGLTLAEKRLVRRLVAGDDLREAATNLHVSAHTARTQLKTIFGKTGRRSQAALLALATRLSTLRAPVA
jgi:DNA-binding CsgD family transcriptional regulator